MAMTSDVPVQCSAALKEWATVLEAMARGEQIILVRKGGLIEPGTGFELISNTFVFYPTFEHQAVQYLREPFRAYFDQAAARRAPEGQIRIELFGLAAASWHVRDPAVLDRLRSDHIYNGAFLSQRLKWQPEQPLVLVVVRAFRFPSPQLIPVIPRYVGCKSWVELDAPVSLDGLQPVLDDAAFEERLQRLSASLRQDQQ